MEVFRRESLFRVDSVRQKNCDQCRRSHVLCDRKKPGCSRCVKMQRACSYNNPLGYRTQVHKMKDDGFSVTVTSTGINRTIKVRVVPLDWKSVFMNSPSDILIRVFLRIYAAPLLPGNPNARQAQGVLSIIAKFKPASKTLPSSSNAELTAPICDMATKAFFRVYNPNLPIFSETSFHSYSRPEIIKLVVIRIGLQCLENSPDKSTFIKRIDEELEATNLIRLPHNLDTLQFLSLLCFGVSSFVHRRMASIIAIMGALLTSLGIHVHLPNHPRNTERRQTFYAASLCIYYMGSNVAYFHMPTSLALHDLNKDSSLYQACSSLRYSEPSGLRDIDRVTHFVTIVCLVQFTWLLAEITREHIQCLKFKTPGHKFAKFIEATDKKLQSLFTWGWRKLTRLRDSSTGDALLKNSSRVILALNYHINRIKLMKLASHISLNPKSPLCAFEDTHAITPANIRGLASSLTVVHLLKRFPPVPGGTGFRQLMQPSSFLISHLGAIKKAFSAETQARFLSSIELAKAISDVFFRYHSPQPSTENLDLLKETLEFCKKS